MHLLLKTANEGGMANYYFTNTCKFVNTGICFLWYICEIHPSNGILYFLLGSLLYEQLGMKAFGMAGKLAASGSITMQNIGGEDKILKCLYCQ